MYRLLALTLAACLATGTASADIYGLSEGAPDLQSAGSLAFGPDGILFVGDAQGAAIFAIRTGDRAVEEGSAIDLQIEGFNTKLADELGVTPGELQINDLVVNPATGNLFFSLSVGGEPSIVRLGADGSVSPLDLSEIAFSKAALPNPPADEEVGEGNRRRNLRLDSITDLAFVDGQLLISGLTNAEAPSSIRSIMFPFAEVDSGTSLEIYHAAHGRSEDYAAVRTFVPIIIDGEPNVLAGFVCTPLVRFPVSEIAEGAERIEGTTVAELGNRNRPLDLISYEQDGQNYLLMSNSARGVMKISTEGIGREEGITEPIPDGGTGGQTYETIDSLAGTVQLEKLNDTEAVVLIDRGTGSVDLHTVPLP